MQCGNCGHELTTGAGFCGNCGAQIAMPAAPPPAYGTPPMPPTEQPSAPTAPHSPLNQPPPSSSYSPPAPQSQQYQQPMPPQGQPPYPGIQPVQLHPSSKYNELSIIAAILLFFFPPASLVLGIIALNTIKRTHEQGRGLAIASIIIGGIIVAFFVLIIALAASAPEAFED